MECLAYNSSGIFGMWIVIQTSPNHHLTSDFEVTSGLELHATMWYIQVSISTGHRQSHTTQGSEKKITAGKLSLGPSGCPSPTWGVLRPSVWRTQQSHTGRLVCFEPGGPSGHESRLPINLAWESRGLKPWKMYEHVMSFRKPKASNVLRAWLSPTIDQKNFTEEMIRASRAWQSLEQGVLSSN